jgi:hypothetical protein|tara:strand:+ start:475 stop:648 length:174 start_codon:yes stop_codon:yes gene_type:complete
MNFIQNKKIFIYYIMNHLSSRKQYPEGSKNKPKEEEEVKEGEKLVINLDVSGNPTFN